MRGGETPIFTEGRPRLVSITLESLGDVYRRYFAETLQHGGWHAPQPATTPVYTVLLSGRFVIHPGPERNFAGTYSTGVRVFAAVTGDRLLEGGVGWIGP